MKTLNRNQQVVIVNLLGLISLAFIVMFLSSCNKDFPNTLRTEYPNDSASVGDGKRKVLYIILDGVRGGAVNTLSPSNLTYLSRTGIKTYDALTDFQSNAVTNAGGWANMTTGVDYLKHKVVSNDFAGSDLTAYPTLFTRLKTSGNVKTASFAASADFNTKLAADATVSQNFASDLEVKDAVINEIKNSNSDLIVGQFHSAETAAQNGGYEVTNTNYATAIRTLDTYVGAIITELRSRPLYSKENWLIVVASSKGGAATADPNAADLGAYGDPTRNSFVIFYNPKFAAQNLERPSADTFPYIGYAPRFSANYTQNGIATLANTSIGNFGSSGDFTFMFKMKNNSPNALYYPIFFAKTTNFGDLANGWSFLFGENGYQLDWGGSPRPNGAAVRDGIWHTIGFKIFVEDGKRKLALFTDGIKNNTVEIGTRNMDNTAPMRIGSKIAGDGSNLVDILIKDVVILNKSLSDADMTKYMRKEMTTTNPLFPNLVGWWPFTEINGPTFADKSGKGNNFTANGNVTVIPFEDTAKNISPEITLSAYRAVINNTDIPVQIYQWMGISGTSAWGLDGKIWKLNYTDLRN